MILKLKRHRCMLDRSGRYDPSVAVIIGPNPEEKPMPPTITYDYKEYGYSVHNSSELGSNEICLDVGNAFVEGVIDHHHLNPEEKRESGGIFGSTANMLRTLLLWEDGTTELWESAPATLRRIKTLRESEKEIKIILHREPDLDSLFSAFLLEKYLTMTEEDFGNKVVSKLLRNKDIMTFINQADEGKYEHQDFDNDYNIYYILEYLNCEIGTQKIVGETDTWEKLRHEFFKFLDGFVEQEKLSLLEYGERYVKENNLQVHMAGVNINDLYKSCLANTPPNYEGIIFQFSENRFEITRKKFLFVEATDKLLHVFNLFKARKRKESNRIWVVHYSPEVNAKIKRHRYLISIDGSETWGLFGYGWHLETLEKYTRRKLSKLFPLYPLRRGKKRWGYHGPDPWYNDRPHDYTILDSPNCGTILGEVVEKQHELKKILGKKDSSLQKEIELSYYPNINSGMTFLDFISFSHPLWPESLIKAVADYAERNISKAEDMIKERETLTNLLESIRKYLFDLDTSRKSIPSGISSEKLKNLDRRLTEIVGALRLRVVHSKKSRDN